MIPEQEIIYSEGKRVSPLDELMIADRNGVKFNPVPGMRFLTERSCVQLQAIYWCGGKRVRVDLMDEQTGKGEEVEWGEFEALVGTGVLTWV